MPRTPRDRLPFWVHQTVEYGAGFLVASQAIAAPEAAVPVAAGVALVLLAATADGPLGLFRWVPRRVHHGFDWVAGGGLVVLGVLGGRWTSEIGQVFTVVTGLVLLVLAWRTDYRTRPSRAQRKAAATAAADPAAPASPPAPGQDPSPPTPDAGQPAAPPARPTGTTGLEGLGRRLGRAVGKGVTSYRAPGSPPPPAGGSDPAGPADSDSTA